MIAKTKPIFLCFEAGSLNNRIPRLLEMIMTVQFNKGNKNVYYRNL